MTTELDLEPVRGLHPDHGPSAPDVRAGARADLMRAIESEREPVPRQRPARRRPRIRPLPAIGAAALVSAILAALLVVASPHGGVAQPQSAAAAVLQRAARSVEVAGGPRRLLPGEFWYVHSRRSTLGIKLPGHAETEIDDAITTQDVQVWGGLGTKGYESAHQIGPIRFLTNGARERWLQAGRPRPLNSAENDSLPPSDFMSNSINFSYRRLLALPTNVNALWNVLARNTNGGAAGLPWRHYQMFGEIGELLSQPVRAGVRAALYRVAALIPGIRMAGMTHDSIGRRALAVVLEDSLFGTREELLFSPRTAMLLEERGFIVKPGRGDEFKPGTLEYEHTFLASGVVSRIGQKVRREGRS